MSFRVEGFFDFLYDRTCTITRPGTTTAANISDFNVGVDFDGSGDTSEDTGVPCQLQPAAAVESNGMMRPHDGSLYDLMLPSSYSVPNESRITIASEVYDVVAPGQVQGEGSDVQIVSIRKRIK